MYKHQLNTKSFTAFSILFLVEGMNLMSTYPVLPYFIEWALDLSDTTSPKDKDFIISYSYSFYVLVYNAFQFLAIFFWSICIERINFKLMIMMGLIINAIYFSVSPSIPNIFVAVALRAMQGLFSINIGILKLLLDNYITFQYQEGKVFVLTSLWTVGAIVGMCITALLTSNKSTSIINDASKLTFFQNYKFFLPFIFLAFLNLIAFLFTLCLFPRSLPNNRNYQKTMVHSLKLQNKLILSQNESSIYLIKSDKRKSICNSALRKELCRQDGTPISIAIFALMNVLFFGIFESIPLIYKDVFEMSDAMVAGLFFSVGLFVMFLTDNIFSERLVDGHKRSLNEIRGIWIGIVIFFAMCLFIHYLGKISMTVKLIILIIWQAVFMLLFTLAWQTNISVLLFSTSKKTKGYSQNFAQILGSLGRILGGFGAIQLLGWGMYKFNVDVMQKGLVFLAATFVALVAWLLHFQYGDVFQFHFQQYLTAEEARFHLELNERKNFVKASSSEDQSHVNYA